MTVKCPGPADRHRPRHRRCAGDPPRLRPRPSAACEAISTVAGNVSVDLATANAFRILAAARPIHRPRVARGAAGPAATTARHRRPRPWRRRARQPRPVPSNRTAARATRAHASTIETRDGADLILETAGSLRRGAGRRRARAPHQCRAGAAARPRPAAPRRPHRGHGRRGGGGRQCHPGRRVQLLRGSRGGRRPCSRLASRWSWSPST